jgi:hypothetical protein
VSLNSPRIAKRLRFSLIYARMRAEGWGGISGGLTEAGHSEDTLSGDPAATQAGTLGGIEKSKDARR